VNIIKKEHHVRNVEVEVYVNTVGRDQHVKNVKEEVYVNIQELDVSV
jgi:hypothetical protein